MISLLAGKPNAALFPFTSVQFTAPAPGPAAAADGSEPTSSSLLKVDDDLLAMGLQYAPTSGIPPMVEWLTEFQEQEHAPRRRSEGWRISVTAGSQDAIYKVRRLRAPTIIMMVPVASVVDSLVLCLQAVQALVDPGDPVLIEKPVYAYARAHTLSLVVFSKSPDASCATAV